MKILLLKHAGNSELVEANSLDDYLNQEDSCYNHMQYETLQEARADWGSELPPECRNESYYPAVFLQTCNDGKWFKKGDFDAEYEAKKYLLEDFAEVITIMSVDDAKYALLRAVAMGAKPDWIIRNLEEEAEKWKS